MLFLLGGYLITNLIGNSNNMLDEATKKLILNAAEEYAMEFSNNPDWKEEVDKKGNRIFCVTVESLINYGYFGANYEKVNDYKNDYSIKITVENGVYNYDIINKDNSDDICKYYKEEINITENSSGSSSILENDVSIGNINYEVNKIEDNIFEMNINFGIDFKIEELVKSIPTYVTLVVDKSGSMNGTKYDNAKNVAISFSEKIINDIPDSWISLIQYSTNSIVKNSFAKNKLDSSYFDDANGNTNTSGGLDMATALFYNLQEKENVNSESANYYTILLYDGEPNRYSYIFDNWKNMNSNNITDENKKTILKNLLQKIMVLDVQLLHALIMLHLQVIT